MNQSYNKIWDKIFRVICVNAFSKYYPNTDGSIWICKGKFLGAQSSAAANAS